MMRTPFLVVLCATLMCFGCDSDEDDTTDAAEDAATDVETGPPFGSAEDVAAAQALWTSIADYDTWPLMPGTAAAQESGAPHSGLATIHINETAAADTSAFANGSILVKVNIGNDGASPDAYTVMHKVEGFNSDDQDWFWAKYDPNGDLMTNGDGVPLAGAIGKGGTSGCIACHQAETDYVFTN